MSFQFLKTAVFSISFLGLVASANAQSARPTKVVMDKVERSAFQADYKQPKKLIECTLEDKFKKLDLPKAKKTSGFRKYEGVTITELSGNKIDLYYKVEGKKSAPSVIMLVSTGYDNFIEMGKDDVTAANTILFLNNLENDAKDMQAAIDLAAQQEALKKAEDKLKKAEAKRAKANKQLTNDANAKAEAAKKVEEERLRLENLKGRNEN